MFGLFKAAAATQSVAALMADFSNSLRSIASAEEAAKVATAIPNATGRYLGILTFPPKEARKIFSPLSKHLVPPCIDGHPLGLLAAAIFLLFKANRPKGPI
jgi:hypothetical protein